MQNIFKTHGWANGNIFFLFHKNDPQAQGTGTWPLDTISPYNT